MNGVNTEIHPMSRKRWVDLLRGICMVAILLDHTEIYYTGANIIGYNVYVANALVLFFILSGYLTYKDDGFDIKKKLCSIARSLLLPYFLFSILLSLPKALVHGNGIEIGDILLQMVSGQSSWFVAALCVSELVFALAVRITRGRTTALTIIGVLGFCLSICLSKGNRPYIWQLDNSLQALLFLSMGYAYHKHEKVFDTICRIPYTCLLFLLLVIIKIYEYADGVNMMIWYIDINNYPVFLTDIFICSILCVQLSKMMPPVRWLEWTGAHSLVYYFLCGGIPLLTSRVFERLGWAYQGNYLQVVAVMMCVYAITTVITWAIYQYIPFITGKVRR